MVWQAEKPLDERSSDLGDEYRKAISALDRLYRLMLDVIKYEIDRLGIHDLTNTQALLLYRMQGQEIITVGELSCKGHYGVDKATYNIRRLVKFGYLAYKPLKADKRSVGVTLTEKGAGARHLVDALLQRQLLSLESVAQVSQTGLGDINRSLGRLENFWVDQLRYRL